jgi:predicted ATPase
MNVAMVYQLRREVQNTSQYAAAAIALTTEQGFTQWLAMGTALRSWALAMRGQGHEGIVQIRQAITAWQATGAGLCLPYLLGLLAEAYGAMAQPAAGLPVLAEALALVDSTEERWWAAELHRLSGELLLAQADNRPESKGQGQQWQEAEAHFHQALAIARQQQARSLELRAAMSLSGLWRQQGKYNAAQELLAPIYGWFTEGFATADLQEAKILLEALGT